MDSRDAIKLNLDMAAMVCGAYLGDITDEEMMKRPHPGCNHLKWQVGHLISSEHHMIENIAPGSMPTLPDGFAEKYSKETTSSDNSADFHSKDELHQLSETCRAATLKVLAAISDERLLEESPEEIRSYAPTVASALSLQGAHWLMHCGQWAVLRRELDKPIVI